MARGEGMREIRLHEELACLDVCRVGGVGEGWGEGVVDGCAGDGGEDGVSGEF